MSEFINIGSRALSNDQFKAILTAADTDKKDGVSKKELEQFISDGKAGTLTKEQSSALQNAFGSNFDASAGGDVVKMSIESALGVTDAINANFNKLKNGNDALDVTDLEAFAKTQAEDKAEDVQVANNAEAAAQEAANGVGFDMDRDQLMALVSLAGSDAAGTPGTEATKDQLENLKNKFNEDGTIKGFGTGLTPEQQDLGNSLIGEGKPFETVEDFGKAIHEFMTPEYLDTLSGDSVSEGNIDSAIAHFNDVAEEVRNGEGAKDNTTLDTSKQTQMETLITSTDGKTANRAELVSLRDALKAAKTGPVPDDQKNQVEEVMDSGNFNSYDEAIDLLNNMLINNNFDALDSGKNGTIDTELGKDDVSKAIEKQNARTAISDEADQVREAAEKPVHDSDDIETRAEEVLAQQAADKAPAGATTTTTSPPAAGSAPAAPAAPAAQTAYTVTGSDSDGLEAVIRRWCEKNGKTFSPDMVQTVASASGIENIDIIRAGDVLKFDGIK